MSTQAQQPAHRIAAVLREGETVTPLELFFAYETRTYGEARARMRSELRPDHETSGETA